MELKDTIITIIICLVVCSIFSFVLPKQSFGGQIYHGLTEDFAGGIKVNGTTLFDSSRNISAGTLSGSDLTLTGDATVTDELNLGTSVSNPGCIKFYTTNGLTYIYGVTTSAAGTLTITSTKPSVCP